jgi:hypothetical protein
MPMSVGIQISRSSIDAIGLVVTCILLSACEALSGYPASVQDDAAVINADQPYFSPNVRSIGESPLDSDRGGLTQRQYRDMVVYRQLEAIDLRYFEFEAALTSTYNTLDVAADLAVLVLSGFGATTGGAATKAALAAASAGIVGAKTVVQTDVFYQKTLPALIVQMRASRQTALATIKSGLATDVSMYSIDQALNDVKAYYVGGTLPSAISQVTAQAGATLDAANKKLDLVRDAAFKQGLEQTSSLLDRVTKLMPAQALVVAKLMEPNLSARSQTLQQNLKNSDPRGKHLQDGAIAKAFLQQWVVQDDRDSASQKQWANALDIATK